MSARLGNSEGDSASIIWAFIRQFTRIGSELYQYLYQRQLAARCSKIEFDLGDQKFHTQNRRSKLESMKI